MQLALALALLVVLMGSCGGDAVHHANEELDRVTIPATWDLITTDIDKKTVERRYSTPARGAGSVIPPADYRRRLDLEPRDVDDFKRVAVWQGATESGITCFIYLVIPLDSKASSPDDALRSLRASWNEQR